MAAQGGQGDCAAAAAAALPTAAVARRRPKPNPLAGRIRRIMKADEDVGKISQATPGMIGGPPALSYIRPQPGAAASCIIFPKRASNSSHQLAALRTTIKRTFACVCA